VIVLIEARECNCEAEKKTGNEERMIHRRIMDKQVSGGVAAVVRSIPEPGN